MDDPLFHPATARQLETFVSRPGHGLLLIGPVGSGKYTAAQYVAARLLATTPSKLDSYPYYLHIAPQDAKFSIDSPRSIVQFLKTKTAGTGSTRRLVIIEDADLLSPRAQNTLLKVLEEPPTDTVLVLTASSSEQLLATVRSRLQSVIIRPLTREMMEMKFGSAPRFDQAVRYSGGLVGLLVALLDDNQEHPLVQAIQDARHIYAASYFERLTVIDKLTKEKAELPIFMEAMQRIAEAGLLQSAINQSSVTRWQRCLEAVYTSREALRHNANPKLTLTYLMLNL